MLTGLLFLLAAGAPDAAPDPCAVAQACRKVESVRVQSPSGKDEVVAVGDTLPWVVEDNLLLVPGDWIIIRLAENGGALKPVLLRAGSDGVAPQPGPGEIRFRLNPYDKGMIIVEVLSNRTETLDYAALIVTPSGPQRTSVCSLRPGLPVFESWGQPIRQFAFWSFRPTTEPGCKTLAFPKKG